MKKTAILLCLFILLLPGINSRAQQHPFEAKGFFEYNNTTWAPSGSAIWTGISGVYNRLDLHAYAGKQLTFAAGIRTNVDYGSMMAAFYPYYGNYLTQDNGKADMTFTLADDTSYLFYTNIDRLNVKWSIRKFELTLGRQRINWGTNLIWNPNDIFNTYNYFNFDYVERPGSDAVLLQWYTGDLSSLQIAAKLDHNDRLTAAAMYKFNLSGYDIQMLGGVMDKDLVLGTGWAGQIKGAGFTGEATYFRDMDHFSDTTGQWVASVAANYTFRNSLFINGSVIYNSTGTTGNAGLRNFFEMGDLSPKTLTLAKLNWFLEASYPITPLIKVDISAIGNPYDGSAFIGPSLDFSLTDNLELFVMGQLFTGKNSTEYGDFGQLYYLRVKWSF